MVWNKQDDSTKKRAHNETILQLAEAFQSDHDLSKSVAALHESFLLVSRLHMRLSPHFLRRSTVTA